MQKADEADAKVAGTVKGPDKGQAHKDALADAEQVYRADAGFSPHVILAAAYGNSAAHWIETDDCAATFAARAAHHAFSVVPGLR